MNSKEEIGRIVVITLTLSILFVAAQALSGVELLSFNGVKSAFSTTVVLSIWWWFYFNFGWKIKLLRQILYKQNINGTWFGNYESEDIKTGNIYEGEISLVIKQNYLTIKITSLTDKFKNNSYSEELISNADDEKRLVYIYSQNELSSTDHLTRKGTSELELTISEDKSAFTGKFWTNYGTIGSLNFIKISDKHIRFFDKAKELHMDSKKTLEECVTK